MKAARRVKAQTVKRERNRVDKEKIYGKRKQNGVKKKKFIETPCESNINTAVEEFFFRK